MGTDTDRHQVTIIVEQKRRELQEAEEWLESLGGPLDAECKVETQATLEALELPVPPEVKTQPEAKSEKKEEAPKPAKKKRSTSKKTGSTSHKRRG